MLPDISVVLYHVRELGCGKVATFCCNELAIKQQLGAEVFCLQAFNVQRFIDLSLLFGLSDGRLKIAVYSLFYALERSICFTLIEVSISRTEYAYTNKCTVPKTYTKKRIVLNTYKYTHAKNCITERYKRLKLWPTHS